MLCQCDRWQRQRKKATACGLTVRPELYVIDRGYAEYQLFQDIHDADSHFIGRIRDNAVYKLVEERPLSDEARKAGVVRDVVAWLGCEQSGEVFKQPLRVVWVKTGKTDSQGRPEILLLASDLVDVDAAWIALGYKFRWTVELFFRWFKCILGCQHLLSTCQNGVTIQVYLGATIASLLVSLWTGHKPTKRTFEMLCFYFSGWASEAELQAHVQLERAKEEKEANVEAPILERAAVEDVRCCALTTFPYRSVAASASVGALRQPRSRAAAGEGCCALSKFPSRRGSGSDTAVGEAGSFADGVTRPDIFLNRAHLSLVQPRSRVSPLSSRPIAR